MPALALRSRPAAFDWPLQSECSDLIPEPQGVEGRKVREAARAALRHWNERAEHLLSEQTPTDEVSYDSIPLEAAFAVRVKYKYIGELKPLPYPLDE